MIPSTSLLRALRALVFVPIVSTAALAAGQETLESRWATLEAIHNLENPNDLCRPGPCGELGAYQFRESTWRLYSHEPFVYALNRHSSDTVAIAHYEKLKRVLGEHGLPASAYYIALAWNGGIGAVFSRRPNRAARDYAERASNLAAEFDRQRMAAAR